MVEFRTTSTRLGHISPEERRRLARFQERFGPDHEGALRREAEKLAALRASCSAERRSVLSEDQRDAIGAAVGRGTEERPRPGRRYLSLVEARRHGVDLDRLKTVHDRFYRDFAELRERETHFSSGDVTVRALDAPFDWPPALLPPDPDAGTTFVPPFGEPWERSVISNASGDGRVTENRSYLDAEWGRIGSRLAAVNHDASDHDDIMVYRQNGFVVPFTTTTTGVLRVTADLICLLCRHHISTSDEWGWSDFFGMTHSSLVLAVFWDHDDGEPTSQDAYQSFVPGLDSHGDGESYPGTVVQVHPGEPRSVDFYTDVAFPAGKTVWVYVGVADFVWVALNDVSIDVSLDSAWQLSSLRVVSL